MAWIRLLGLPSYLYNKKVLEEIDRSIGKVVKLDFNTDNRLKGQFSQMAIFVNLDKSLISQIMMKVSVQDTIKGIRAQASSSCCNKKVQCRNIGRRIQEYQY
ncbi:hypothetical protein Godav_010470 [Gossypium davidsonii]|uniref:DUF4283 domain-containing protein n=1 Tax=Gossypium davidsonii TaxID=34287 RepID=A0A7J8SGI7_GOSDV|nr:hypothetical protein [Gossypium davidsonii]